MADLFLVTPAPTQLRLLPEDDSYERERALDTTQSFIVEAPAGSGKTGILTQRFLKLLASEHVEDPSQVLAITFTRKATSEMRERVLAQLAAAALSAPPSNLFDLATRPLAEAALARDRQRGWNLLDNPARLRIRTIDSVCAEIASALPVLSGSGGNQEPLDYAGPLYTEAARRTLILLGSDDRVLSKSIETLLLHRDGNLAECTRLVAAMLGSRDQWGSLVPLTPQHLDDAYLDGTVLPRLDRALELVICRGLTRLAHHMPASLLDQLSALAAEMAYAGGYKGDASPIALCRDLASSPQETAEHLEHWQALIGLLLKSGGEWRRRFWANDVGFEILKQHRGELETFVTRMSSIDGLQEILCQVQSLPPAQYPRQQWPVQKALFHVLSRALIELQLVFRESGKRDHPEAGLLARRALRADSSRDDLVASLGGSLLHLLVDEMQDTSSTQYELLHLLTAGWDGHSQTVFLVGDPKQSIYLFREARVERFVATMLQARFGELPLESLRLNSNFRSDPELVSAFNQDFSAIFPPDADPQAPENVPYKLSMPALPRSGSRQAPSPGRILHASAVSYESTPAGRTLRQRTQAVADAAEICKVIAEWRARPLPPERTAPWKIGILVRKRADLREIFAALKRASPPIPYRAVDIEPLGERQEILDLVALTRALLHPADRTAWLALLRSPFCGLTLPDLHRLAGKDDRTLAEETVFAAMENCGDGLSPDGIARLQPFWTVMTAALKQRGQIPLAVWVRRTWLAFGAPAYASADALTNTSRYFDLLADLEQPGGNLDLPELESSLARLFATPSLNPDAVELTTIHKSKGLEWDLVVVPSLERVSRATTGRLLSWIETDSDDDAVAPGILAPINVKGGSAKRLNAWIHSVQCAREAAERKRLFYVACTRARHELHLFASPRFNSDGEVIPASTSLLSAAWPALEPLFRPTAVAVPAPVSFPPSAVRASYVLDFVAAAEAQTTNEPSIIDRLPLSTMHLGSPSRTTSDEALAHLSRPQGSFTQRAFGNVLHALLHHVADRIVAGETADALLEQLPTWAPRVRALLRSAAIGPGEIERFHNMSLHALRQTLNDPVGRWILAAHPQASSESALISWKDARSSIRLDRTFLAGPEPRLFGTDHRWILDYKTANHGREGLDTFLTAEKMKYAAQMTRHAEALALPGQPIRVALYYPMLSRLIWWDPAGTP